MRRSYFRVMSRLFGVPLAIEPTRFQVAIASLASRFDLDPDRLEIDGVRIPAVRGFFDKEDDSADDGEDPAPPEPYQNLGGVAVIPVMGELVQRSSWMDAASGLTSYETLSSALSQALDDSAVKAVLLHVDSPGGEVAGLNEFADEVFAARGAKPIAAVSDDCACSAAYLVASSAEKFYVPQAGAIGNIGVIVSHVDTTERDAKRGVKITRFYGGARKGDYWEPINDDSAAALKKRVRELHSIFAEKVARNRAMSVDDVFSTEAAFYVGAKAVELGLADAVKPMARVLSEMQAAIAAPARRQAVPIPTPTPSVGAPTPFAAQPDPQPSPNQEPPMSTIQPVVPPTAAAPATPDPRDAKIAELTAQNAAHELNVANERKAKRESVFEKHAKRLSPATMASMRQSLAGVDDPGAVDGVLGKIRDEVSPLAPATPAIAADGSPSSKPDDPELELIDRAKARVKESASTHAPLNLQDAMLAVLKEDPKLKDRVHKQRTAYFNS